MLLEKDTALNLACWSWERLLNSTFCVPGTTASSDILLLQEQRFTVRSHRLVGHLTTTERAIDKPHVGSGALPCRAHIVVSVLGLAATLENALFILQVFQLSGHSALEFV